MYAQYINVTIGNVTVAKQEVSLISEAYWEGDGVTSGLMGWAYPAITSAYDDDDSSDGGYGGSEGGSGGEQGEGGGQGGGPGQGGYRLHRRQSSEEDETQVPYNPWIFSAISAGTVSPLFSLALSRGNTSATSGSLAIGGLPSTVDWEGDFAVATIEIANLEDDSITSTNYSFYTIQPDGFYLTAATAGSSKKFISMESASRSERFKRADKVTTTNPVIIDSGTTLIYLSETVAKEINEAFDPPATYSEDEEAWLSKADSTPPTLSVSINGTEFAIAAADLLPTDLGEVTDGYYVTGVQPSDSVYILGKFRVCARATVLCSGR